MKNILKKPSNLTLQIDEYEVDGNQVKIKGWGFSNQDSTPLDFEIDSKFGRLVELDRITRLDICNLFNITKDPKLGFELTIESNTSNPKSFPITFTDQNNNSLTQTVSDKVEINHSLPEFLGNSLKTFFKDGFEVGFNRIKKQKRKKWSEVDKWIFYDNYLNPYNIKRQLKGLKNNPKFSIIVPVYNLDKDLLSQMIESVLNQYYPNFELILVDDNSPNPDVLKTLKKYESQEDRIKVVERKTNGHISEATNSGLKVATGDFIGFLDHDDLLEPNTLLEYAKYINNHPEVEILYCDQDYMDLNGHHTEPNLKPDFNYRLLLAHNYITHFLVIKKDITDEIGLFNSEMNGAQDYDYLLRAVEKSKNVGHIPKVLYHWRMIEGSVAENPEAKMYAYENGRKALQNFYDNNDISAKSKISPYYGLYELEIKEKPKVSIICFFDEREASLSVRTLQSLIDFTNYDNYEILAINYPISLLGKKVKYIHNNYLTDIKKAYEYGAKKAEGEYLCFVHAGIIATENWLTQLVNETAVKSSGLIAPVIENRKEKIASAGLYFDYEAQCVYFPEQNRRKEDLGHFFRLTLPQAVEAVSSFCFLIKKSLFEKLKFPLKYNEPLRGVALCNQVLKLGYDIVIDPFSRVIWNGDDSDDYEDNAFEKRSLIKEREEFLKEYPEELVHITQKNKREWYRKKDKDFIS